MILNVLAKACSLHISLPQPIKSYLGSILFGVFKSLHTFAIYLSSQIFINYAKDRFFSEIINEHIEGAIAGIAAV